MRFEVRRFICKLVGCRGMAYAVVKVDTEALKAHVDERIAEELLRLEREHYRG